MKLRLATRGSALARWQTAHVAARLAAHDQMILCEEIVIQTTGDRVTDVPLFGLGDRGLFTKEIDDAVLSGRADVAVHSLKDLPTKLEPGLALAAVLDRADPRDALVGPPGTTLGELPAGAIVGTSSLRRRAQLLSLRPDLAVEDLRGNVDTRVRRVREGRLDAAILALAGLQRLGLEENATDVLDPAGWLPAPGQGALAVVARENDTDTIRVLQALDHAETRAATLAERALLAALEGGCQVPVGALATAVEGELRLRAFVGTPDGRSVLRGETAGSPRDAVQLGARLAAELLERGADGILAEVRDRMPSLPPVPAP